jgi:hypothetical protein
MDDKKSFEAARAESIAANREFIQGNPEPLKRLYSHADDITIFGGFGASSVDGPRPSRASIGRPRSLPAEVSKKKISA